MDNLTAFARTNPKTWPQSLSLREMASSDSWKSLSARYWRADAASQATHLTFGGYVSGGLR